jgi:NitT/TauT family transport system ATP-binding protein
VSAARAVKIRVRGAGKRFARGAVATEVLRPIDLDVYEREFLAIVGPSGCGKTTLLLVLAGFIGVDGGTIEIDGAPVRAPSPRRIVVFQESSVFPWMTVEENIAFGLGALAPAERAAIVAAHVDLVGLQGFEQARPAELSGGMKQRLELARALAVDPDVLFLDEPFGALDAITRVQMRREVARIWNTTRQTCVLVTHDVEEALVLADRVVVLSARPGAILEILSNPLAHPRDPDDATLREKKARIYALLDVDRRV